MHQSKHKLLTISKSLQRIQKSAMRSRDVKIQISMRLPLEGDVLDHVLRFTRCKDLEIVSTNSGLHTYGKRVALIHSWGWDNVVSPSNRMPVIRFRTKCH